MKGKIAAMFAMLATIGASLPGTDIRPPARTAQDTKDNQCKSVTSQTTCDSSQQLNSTKTSAIYIHG